MLNLKEDAVKVTRNGLFLSTIIKINKMDNTNTSQGFQTDRDNNYKEDIVTDKYTNVSKVKPLQFLNHVYKSVLKKKSASIIFYILPNKQM